MTKHLSQLFPITYCLLLLWEILFHEQMNKKCNFSSLFLVYKEKRRRENSRSGKDLNSKSTMISSSS